VADPEYLDLPLAGFLDRVAAATPAPGAGAVSATVVALAAGLTSMAAGLSRRRLDEAEQLAERAQQLRKQAEPLAQRDADAYGAVLAARALPPDDPDRKAAVRVALSGAADVPVDIADLGMAVLEIAVDVAARGNPALRGDALTGGLLAQAAVTAAAALVDLNLDDPRDPRRVHVAELVGAAREALPPGTLPWER
jgi:formiminotetrahydrofolate cyclodeaminase